jgi:hypothetical protein
MSVYNVDKDGFSARLVGDFRGANSAALPKTTFFVLKSSLLCAYVSGECRLTCGFVFMLTVGCLCFQKMSRFCVQTCPVSMSGVSRPCPDTRVLYACPAVSCECPVASCVRPLCGACMFRAHVRRLAGVCVCPAALRRMCARVHVSLPRLHVRVHVRIHVRVRRLPRCSVFDGVGKVDARDQHSQHTRSKSTPVCLR